uniref:Uncharacterized protein n=1 Tax=Anguilla anguilla TaxID=7936 RepID=A0A0E9SFG7_ANGAN
MYNKVWFEKNSPLQNRLSEVNEQDEKERRKLLDNNKENNKW